MKSFRLLSLAIFSCSLLNSSFAQQSAISDEIKTAFPAYVVYRVNEVCSKISVPESEQQKIARYFLQQDSLANKSLHDGGDANLLGIYYRPDDQAIQKLLTPLEWNDYVCRNDKYPSQSAAVLKYRNQIGLTPGQTDNLLKITQQLPALKANSGFDQNAFEQQHIPGILNRGQLDKYLAIINGKTAERNTAGDWGRLGEAGLSAGLDSASVCTQIYNYEFKRATAANKSFSDNDNDALLKAANAEKPDALIKLAVFWYQVPYSPLNEFVKYRDSLGLTDAQKNGLIQLAIDHERQRLQNIAKDTSIDTRAADKLMIGRLLDTAQIDRYLAIVNRRSAVSLAANDLKKLETAGLLQDQDTAAVNTENLNYELGILIARDRIPYSDDQKMTFLLTDARNNVPPLLKALDAKNKTAQSSQQDKAILSW